MTEAGIQVEQQWKAPFVVAEPDGRREGLAVPGAALKRWRHAYRIDIFSLNGNALDTIDRQLDDEVTPGFVDGEPRAIAPGYRQGAHVEQGRNRIASAGRHRQHDRAVGARLINRTSRAHGATGMVEDEGARDVTGALVLIAFVDLRQQFAIGLGDKDVLRIAELRDPPRR